MSHIDDRVVYEWECGVATGWIVDLVPNQPDAFIRPSWPGAIYSANGGERG